jgi:hypothetical protein
MLRTYRGSCHCGAVRFEADLDLTQSTFRCNCSICRRTRFWPAVVAPAGFRLLQGRDDLTRYLFNTRKNEHWFCTHCGVRAFGHGDIPEIGGKYVSVKVNCLDDVSPEELLAAPVQYCDGRNNNWWETPAEVRHL